MPLFQRKPPARPARLSRGSQALTASAVTISRANADGLRRLSQRWQERALAAYDVVPECWYPAQGYARSLKRIRWFPAVLDERGHPVEVESGPLVELFQRIQDPGGGGISGLAASYGQLQFLIGDGYLTVTEEDGAEVWEYLSPVELRAKPGSAPLEYRRIRAPGMTPEELIDAPDGDFEPVGDQAQVWRLWNRHPTYSAWADSPVNAVLDLYDLLQSLTLAASALSNSRAASRGLLFVPEELDFGTGDSLEPDEDTRSNPLVQMLEAAFQAALANPGTAAAAMPLVLQAKGVLDTGGPSPTPMADLIRWMPLGPDDKYVEAEMWAKTIDRIANGLDLPVSMVTGDTGAANHWGAWLVDEQGFRLHVAPVADRFSRDLTAAYLRPAAIDAGVPDADMVVIGYDASAAVNHPDETATYREAYRDGVVSPGAYRDKIGATDEDAPTEEELADLYALLGRTPAGTDPFGDPAAQGAQAPNDGGTGGDVQEDSPDPQAADTVNASALQAAHVLGALNLTVHRARELAGNRLITKSQGCEECREKIANVPAASVAAAMGAVQVRALLNGHGEESMLVTGASVGLAVTASGYGVPVDVALELGRLAEQHALRTLYETDAPPLPPGVHAVVAKALR